MTSHASRIRILFLVAFAAGLLIWEILRLMSLEDERVFSNAEAVQSYVDCLQERLFGPSRTGATGFTDVTDAVGLDFEHVVGPLGTYFLPEAIGAGGALADFDGDGRLDVFLVNSGRSPDALEQFPAGTRVENRLFLQTEAGMLVDVTENSGLGDLGYGVGCAVGDVDNDGDLDVYVTNYGADRLYCNNGNATFVDVTEIAGIDNSDWGTSAAFFDYDRDGWLDLVVVNYTTDPTFGHSVACGFRHGLVSYCGPHKFLPTVERLFHNEGLQPTTQGRQVVRFTDVTESAGLTQASSYGFGVVCVDVNRDGWPDIFVANDGAANRLWINQHDGTFLEEALPRGVALNANGATEAGMGVAVGDVNGDGHFDLIVTHLSLETTTMYLGDGSGGFLDATSQAGLRMPTTSHTGWGTALLDLDHDGYLDLPIVNGLVVPCHSGFPFHGEDRFQDRRDVIDNPKAFWLDYADTNLLLMGNGRNGFHDQSTLGGDFSAAVASGRSLIYGDIDDDGDVDLLVTNCGSRARLYRNDLPKQGHWLMLRLLDPELNRDAYGAEVTVKAGGRLYHHLASPTVSYLASNDVRVHFGLGGADHIDQIVVRWPDGPVETANEVFPGCAADRLVTIRRGEGRPIEEQR